MPQPSGTQPPPTYYEILQLPRVRPPHQLAKEDVKAAYHRALLRHHPDKAGKTTTTTPPSPGAAVAAAAAAADQPSSSSYSVDRILAAYAALADPRARRAYDEALDADADGRSLDRRGVRGTHAGVETLDLEGLAFDADRGTWRHGCRRCGSEEGYVLTETELERESRTGEVYVGCAGCSLFVRVVFGVVEEEEGDEEEEEEEERGGTS